MPSDTPLPMSVDLTHHLSTIARTRQPSPLKDILGYMSLPGMVSLAGGLPHSSFFPFHTLSASIFPPSTVLNPESPQAPADSVDISISRTKGPSPYDLSSGLQYSGGRGLVTLESFIRNLTAKLHTPAYTDWDVLLNSGSTDAWNKILTLLVERGDYIITDSQIYPSAGAAFVPLGAKAVPISVDGEGMCPNALEETLATWDESKGRRPRLAYLIPVGQNPLGSTMGKERRQAIYNIAVKYDVVIIEDDPYSMLQFEPWVAGNNPPLPEKADVPTFLSSLSASFLTMDVEGRVIRLDTFSKTLAPGARLGWFTANKMFIERLLRGTEMQTQQPSAFSELIIGEMLRQWGLEGYLEWNANLRDQYRVRRDWMLDALAVEFDLVDAEKSGIQGALGLVAYAKGTKVPVMSFVPPVGGMFVWISVMYHSHPGWKAFSEGKDGAVAAREFEEVIWRKLVDARVLLTPGWYYTPWEGNAQRLHEEGVGHFRIAYSYEPKDLMIEGIRRFAELLTSEWTV